MKNYVNIYTGEVIAKRSIFGARVYFKKDAKKWNYSYRHEDVVTLQEYLAYYHY